MNRPLAAKSLRSCTKFVGAVMVSAMVAGCAAAPPASDKDAVAEYNRANDPLEPWNRGVYSVNTAVDKAVIKPAAERYRDYMPTFLQDRIKSFLNNLRSPVVLVNDILQGNATLADATLSRFMLNSTVGLVGLFDIAGENKVPFHDNDLGKTLGVWGVGEGPYLVLPLLGPSNPRDAFGLAVEAYADPFDRWASNMGYGYTTFGRAAFSGVNRRADNLDSLDEIERTSIDPYSTLRSLYRQYRKSLIEGKPVVDKPHPGLTGEFPDNAELSQETH